MSARAGSSLLCPGGHGFAFPALMWQSFIGYCRRNSHVTYWKQLYRISHALPHTIEGGRIPTAVLKGLDAGHLQSAVFTPK